MESTWVILLAFYALREIFPMNMAVVRISFDLMRLVYQHFEADDWCVRVHNKIIKIMEDRLI